MIDDIVINKRSVIERCLARINEEYRGNPDRLSNFTVQDSIILNLQRACEAAIDLAMHIVAKKHLGIPQDSRDAFELLRKAGVLDDGLTARLKAMVGFRNIAVHDYQSVQLAIVSAIIEHNLTDFSAFVDAVGKKG